LQARAETVCERSRPSRRRKDRRAISGWRHGLSRTLIIKTSGLSARPSSGRDDGSHLNGSWAMAGRSRWSRTIAICPITAGSASCWRSMRRRCRPARGR